MIIKYTNFSDGVHQFKLTETAKKMGLEKSFFGDVELDCKMDKSLHQIILNCDLTVHTIFECDRCGEEIERDFINHFQLSYMFSKIPEESDNFNFKIISPDHDKIDLKDDVYEYAELSIPLKKLCSDDCKGLCPKCGINLNKDDCFCTEEIENSIWAPLQQLKDKLNN
jgi:uncharacterized protein